MAPSIYFMKSPPIQIHDDVAFNRVEAFTNTAPASTSRMNRFSFFFSYVSISSV